MMRLKSTTLVLLIGLALAQARQRGSGRVSKEKSEESDREGKLFSLFTIVNFKNEPCQSTDSLSSGSTQYRNGTCYTSSECGSKGGSSKGSCAAGFGVCCVFTYDTDSDTTINYNDSYIQNPGYPSTYGATNSLSYTVNKCSDDICWLRLDFETFTSVAPTDTTEASGYACNDMLTFSVSSGQTIPTLCGDLTGQHIYIDMGTGSSDTVDINMAFSGSDTNRKWDIKVAQIPCGARYAPTEGCLQWQTGITGQITTFNFADTSGPHLPSQDYSHCIRQAAGYCCVEYSLCSDNDDQFTLNNVKDTNTDFVAMVGTECETVIAGNTVSTGDYIVIEGSADACNSANLNSKYCGQKLNANTGVKFNSVVCDCTPPFYVGIFTDTNADAQSSMVANRGVCLNYRQLPC